MKYCRQGWKDKTLLLAEADEKAGTCSLKNEAGEIVVSGLLLIPDPSKINPASMPRSFATPLMETEAAGPVIDGDKVDEILAKAKEPATKLQLDDLDRVNLPTLLAIVEALKIPQPPANAKAKDLKKAIVDAANAENPAA